MTRSRYVPTRRALLIVNGLTNLTAAGLLLARKPAGAVLGGVFGVTLMLWICIQFYIFPPNFMSTSYFIFGLIQAVTGYMAWVFQGQEAFRAVREDYPRIGTDPRRLVVFFSRMGYVRKVAYEEADYILVHHQNSTYANAAQEMDALLGIRHTGLRSIRCREGVYREKD